MAGRTAVILGASGSVGQALLTEVMRCGGFNRILILTRRPLNLQSGAQVEERLVPRVWLLHPPSQSAIYHYPEMMALIAGR
jgi:uncharacterized protein YbjT (DUF2867 family)